MKKLIFVFSLFLSFGVFAQTSVRFYNLNVKRGYEESVVKTFTDFVKGETWKSGAGILLQAVRFKNRVTHRIVVYGDPENWGIEDERTEDEWSLYRERMNKLTHPNPIDNSMGSIINFSQGDREKNKTARVYDVRVHEPDKFLKAWNRNVKEAKSILGDRRIGLVRYEVGGTPGATHGLIIYGKNDNDVQVTLRKIQKTKAFKEYIESRGKVDYVQTYAVTTIQRF
mgnify:FL=1|tara:strand:+ start:214 stop:891 length:678 start_codon:yes stop_codon:yes gene_type:complete